ncbi:MAG: hypothetical protein B7Z63_04450 [Ignavibacteriae bacterium 37-53-5]|nr:MAG: hypothetical protein B7Z63_04450 [Ignavibacteriae bacterium 37-53-5]
MNFEFSVPLPPAHLSPVHLFPKLRLGKRSSEAPLQEIRGGRKQSFQPHLPKQELGKVWGLRFRQLISNYAAQQLQVH